MVSGLTLKGAGAGLAHMFFPKLELLLKPTVWLDAATQVTILLTSSMKPHIIRVFF